MRKVLAWCLVIITAIVLSFTIIKLVGGLEVISVSASGEDIITLADNTIYTDVGETFTIDIKQENKSDKTKIDIEIENEKDKTVLVLKDEETRTFYANEGGVARIVIKTSNKHYSVMYLDVFVGNGEKDTPFYLAKPEQLAGIGDSTGKYSKYTLNACYKLVSDIDVSSVYGGYWKPLGDFGGWLDGNGYSIQNLTISRTNFMVNNEGVSADFNNCGLFSSITNTGRVYNLKFDNFKAVGDYGTLGTVAGINLGYIERIEVRTVNFDGVRADYIGGIVGVNGSVDETKDGVYNRYLSRVDRCAVNLSFGSENGISGTIGGVVGMNQAGTVIYSYSVGDVTLADGVIFGGVVGYNTFQTFETTSENYLTNLASARIKDCYSAVKVYVAKLSNVNNEIIGGIIGVNYDIVITEDGKSVYLNRIVGCYYDIDNLNVEEADILKQYDGIGSDQIFDNTISAVIDREEKIYFVYPYNSNKMKVAENYYSHERVERIVNKDGKFITEETVVVRWNFEKIWNIDSTLNNGYPILRFEKINDVDETDYTEYDDFSDVKEVKVDVYNLSLSQWLVGEENEISGLATITVYNSDNEVVLTTTSNCDLAIFSDTKIYKQNANIILIYRNNNLIYKIEATANSESYSIINGWDNGNQGEYYWFDSPIACDSDKSLKLWLSEVVRTSKVIFEFNGATTTGPSKSKVVEYGKEYGSLPTPTKLGYIFGGWYLENNFITYIDRNSIVSTTASQHYLYAKWIPNSSTDDPVIQTVTIYLNANGGSLNQTVIVRQKGGTYGALPIPTKAGYVFEGWFADSTLTREVTSTTILVSNSTHILYAKWKLINTNPEKKYVTVSFNANGGSGSMGVQTIEYNVPTQLKGNAFSRYGYTFQGWSTNPNGSIVYTNYHTVTFTNTQSSYLTLYAIWKKNQSTDPNPEVNYLTITFNANGGYGSMSSQIIQYNTQVTLNRNTFTRSGYKFVGWTNGKTGILFTDGQVVKFVKGTSDYLTLYAVWQKETTNPDPVDPPITYRLTISFNSNGGIGSMSNQIVDYNTTITLRSNRFTRSGYTFAGWSTKSSSNEIIFKDGARINFVRGTSDYLTLYAVWTKTSTGPVNPSVNYLTITFNANGGSGTMSKQTVTYEVATSLNANRFTRSGYKFIGWARTSSATSALFGDCATIKFTKGTSDYLTLYAVWQKVSTTPDNPPVSDTLSIYYNANNGSGSMPMQSVKYGVVVTLRTNTFTRSGYRFLGWARTSTSNTVLFRDGASIKFTQGNSDTLTLYAVWQKIESGSTAQYSTITYNANGGSGSMSGRTVERGSTITLNANKFTRSGYTFAGWATSSSASSADFPDRAKVQINAASLTLYAVWTKQSSSSVAMLTISYNANGGSGSMSSQTVNYNVEVTLSSNKFTRSGHTFVGWARSSTATTALFSDQATLKFTKGSSDTLNLYAVWSKQSTSSNVTISYNANGGSGSMSSQTVTKGVYVTLKANAFIRSGYSFAGWTTSPSGTVAIYRDCAQVSITSNLSLYAVWTEKSTSSTASLTISFNANGGSGSMGSQTVSYDVEVTLKANIFTRSGYTFVGWARSSSATSATFSDQATLKFTRGSSDSLSLYAVWQKQSTSTNVTISYSANGGSGSMSSQTVAQGAYVTLRTNTFTRSGYTFAGWTTKPNGTVAIYSNGARISVSSSITLYAVWTKK